MQAHSCGLGNEPLIVFSFECQVGSRYAHGEVRRVRQTAIATVPLPISAVAAEDPENLGHSGVLCGSCRGDLLGGNSLNLLSVLGRAIGWIARHSRGYRGRLDGRIELIGVNAHLGQALGFQESPDGVTHFGCAAQVGVIE